MDMATRHMRCEVLSTWHAALAQVRYSGRIELIQSLVAHESLRLNIGQFLVSISISHCLSKHVIILLTLTDCVTTEGNAPPPTQCLHDSYSFLHYETYFTLKCFVSFLQLQTFFGHKRSSSPDQGRILHLDHSKMALLFRSE